MNITVTQDVTPRKNAATTSNNVNCLSYLIGRYITVFSLECIEEDIYSNTYGKPLCKNGIKSIVNTT